MKNLLNALKNEIGSALEKFGDMILNEIGLVGKEVKALDNRVEKLEKENKKLTLRVENLERLINTLAKEPVKNETVEDVESVNRKPAKKDAERYPIATRRQNMDLLKKVSSQNKALNGDGRFQQDDDIAFAQGNKCSIEISESLGCSDSQYKIVGSNAFAHKLDIENEVVITRLQVGSQFEKVKLDRSIMDVVLEKALPYIAKVGNTCEGVNFLFKGNKLRVTGTDSYRLYTREFDIQKEINADVTIPGHVLKAIKADFKKFGGYTELQISSTSTRMKYYNREITSVNIDGKFPNVEGLVDKLCLTANELDLKDISLENAENFSKLAEDKQNKDKMLFKFSKNVVEISDFEQKQQHEKYTTKMDLEAFKLGLNIKYVKEAMKVSTIMNFNNGSSAVTFKNEKMNEIVVVMPVATK